MVHSFGAEVIVEALENESVDTIFTPHSFFIMDSLFSFPRYEKPEEHAVRAN